MSLNKKISASAILALKEALVAIYWRKKDLRQFIELTLENPLIVSTIDWNENTKYESVSQLIDRMTKRQDMYQTDLLKLVQEVGNINDFSHLEYWDDSKTKIKKAKASVTKLRNQAKGYFDTISELKKAEERREANQEKLKSNISYQQKLGGLKLNFYKIASNPNAQKKRVSIWEIFKRTIYFFDLDPKSAFKVTGEQIDGAFTFDNNDYLLEAKWQEKSEINAADLYTFGGKISGKLKNTLGLFISLGPYSKDCTETGSPITKSMILMDGIDLIQVLEGRIRLNELILIKRRHASQTGEIYYRMK